METDDPPSIGTIIARIAHLLKEQGLNPDGASEPGLLLRYVNAGRTAELLETESPKQFNGQFVDEHGAEHRTRYVVSNGVEKIAVEKITRFLETGT